MSSKKSAKQKGASKTTRSPKKSPKRKSSDISDFVNTASSSTPSKPKIAEAYPTHLDFQQGSFFSYIILGILIRIISALINPVSDCDETYNYWEPTAYLITNYGFQTWEYAPQYALRSYSYLLPQYAIGTALKSLPLVQSSPFLIFYAIRIILSLTCLCCEYYFCQSLQIWFDRRTAFLTFIFLIFSSGMFNCCAAYLPQQFVLCTILLSFGSFFRGRQLTAVLFMGIAAIIGWPFIALLAVPMAIDCMATMGLLTFLLYVILFAVGLCGICIGVDFVYYGKVVLAPLNIFIYNLAVSGSSVEGDDEEQQGQNLYGVDDWTYYVKNLLFNWNVVFLLALCAPLMTNLMVLLFFNKKKKSKIRGRSGRFLSTLQKIKSLFSVSADSNSMIVYRLLHCLTPFWIWYLFFTYMPHKEERFMFVVYPFIALNAALTLTQSRLMKMDKDGNCYLFNFNVGSHKLFSFVITNLWFAVVLIFVVLCSARTVGQVMYYRAPLNTWYSAGEYIRKHDFAKDGVRRNICVGMEWYRIPSSVFVSDVANIKWIRSGFDGQLPAEFEGTNVANQPFNDRNQADESRFVSNVTATCDYVVDLWESNSVITDYDVNEYQVIDKRRFLDRNATPSGIYRSLYIPLLSEMKVTYANYVFLKRKTNGEQKDNA